MSDVGESRDELLNDSRRRVCCLKKTQAAWERES